MNKLYIIIFPSTFYFVAKGNWAIASYMLPHTGDRVSDTPPQILFSGCCAPEKPFDAWLVLFVSPAHTPSAQRKAFCYWSDTTRQQFKWCPSHFIWSARAHLEHIKNHSSSSILSAWAHCLLCLLALFLSEIQVLVLLAALRPACSLRCIASSTHAFVSVRAKLQQWPASKPAAYQHYKSPQSAPFLFVFHTIVQLCYFAFSFFIPLFLPFLHRWLLQPP